MINNNQLTVPCVGSVKQGDSVMIITRNGEPVAVAPIGWGDAIEADISDAAQVAAEAQAVAEATGQHFFTDTDGVHVTEAEGDATTGHNILINALGILLSKVAIDIAQRLKEVVVHCLQLRQGQLAKGNKILDFNAHTIAYQCILGKVS